jgi:hypothetical protein
LASNEAAADCKHPSVSSTGVLKLPRRARTKSATAKVNSAVQPAQLCDTLRERALTDLTVTFTGLATLPANPADAFRLTRTGPTGPTGDVTLAVDPSASNATQTVARLTFSGSFTASGSLVDGSYTLATPVGAPARTSCPAAGAPAGPALQTHESFFASLRGAGAKKRCRCSWRRGCQ